jgi:DNA-binding NtrC family response regulator
MARSKEAPFLRLVVQRQRPLLFPALGGPWSLGYCDQYMPASNSALTARAVDTLDSTSAPGLTLAWVFPEARRFRLAGGRRVLLGRGADADCVTSGSEASRHHAEITQDGPLWIVRDLGSTNGTFLNGERTARGPLGPGSVLRVADSVAVVVLETEEQAALDFREIGPGFFAGPALRHVLEGARRATASDLPIVIEGETGTGKERVARWIHEQSARRGTFVAVNCAALPEPLAEGELFGYRKGAFTGALQGAPGYFRAADAGTLLLDEVLDLPLPLQAKLLRVLQEQEVTPIGEARPVAIDVRMVAASQAPLEGAVRAGQFRGDLHARLDGMNLRIPPLRERIDDVALMFQRFVLAQAGGRAPALEARLLEALCLYDWPFNVRELELLSRRLMILHGHEPMLRRAHLPPRFTARLAATGRSRAPNQVRTGDEFPRFIALLKAHGGIVARAAAAAGISRPKAYRLMAEHDLDPESLREPEGNPP